MGVKGIYYIKLKNTKIIQFLNIFLLSKFLMFKIIKISESPKILSKVEYKKNSCKFIVAIPVRNP